ncbi:MAG: hypothetical protein Q8J64_10240 [Thermodesulfovibrionales bacterium]|nr:hypothetical protein [Thermodesulfovibrionales bacterium]
MGIADDMKKFAHEIVSSYEHRIAAIGEIIDNTHRMLEEFSTSKNEMSGRLKKSLAAGESLRKKDFDIMMKDIIAGHEERQRQVKEMLRTYMEEQKDRASALKRALEEKKAIKAGEFKEMLRDIHAGQRKREEEITGVLRDFQKEHEEMTGSLRSLLAKRQGSRIEDFKGLLNSVRTRRKEQAGKIEAKKGGETALARIGIAVEEKINQLTN